jgi:hypothetical protein
VRCLWTSIHLAMVHAKRRSCRRCRGWWWHRLKDHFLVKSIFGWLLSILRCLTILSLSKLLYRWRSEDWLLQPLSEPETPGLPTGDSGVQTLEALCLGPETPAQDSGPLFPEVSLVPVTGAEAFFPLPWNLWPDSFRARRLRPPRPKTPAPVHLARRLRSCNTGDEGLTRQMS